VGYRQESREGPGCWHCLRCRGDSHSITPERRRRAQDLSPVPMNSFGKDVTNVAYDILYKDNNQTTINLLFEDEASIVLYLP